MYSPRFAALSLSLLMAACSSPEAEPDKASVLLRNDFESLAGWTGQDSPSLTRERAHSGQYAIKTDRDLEYSLTYIDLLGRLSPTRLTKIKVAAWAYSTKPSEAQLTVQLKRSLEDGTTTYNETINLGQAIKRAAEWTPVSKVFTLPADVSAANQLRIFLWRANAPEPVYLDDLVVTREP